MPERSSQRYWRRRWTELVALPELDDLDVLDFAPPGWVDQRLASNELPMWYRPDGTPITGSTDEQVREYGVLFAVFDQHMRVAHTGGVHRAGRHITVSTVFLGLDHSHGDGGPPVLWETMVFQQRNRRGWERNSCWEARYRSRQAAEAGHRVVVDALRCAHRARPERQARVSQPVTLRARALHVAYTRRQKGRRR